MSNNIKLTKLEIEGFLGLSKKVDLKFDTAEGSLILIKGVFDEDNLGCSNGLGKSSICEAVFWCVTGKSIRGIKSFDIINKQMKTATVKIELLFGKDIISVKRIYSKTEKSLIIIINGELKTFHTPKDGTDFLYQYLSIDDFLFSLASFFGSSFIKFSKLAPRDKATLFKRLINADLWENSSKLAHSKLKLIEKVIVQVESQKSLICEHRAERINELAEYKNKKIDLIKREEIELCALKEKKNELYLRIQRCLDAKADLISYAENRKTLLNEEIEKNEFATSKIQQSHKLEMAIAKVEKNRSSIENVLKNTVSTAMDCAIQAKKEKDQLEKTITEERCFYCKNPVTVGIKYTEKLKEAKVNLSKCNKAVKKHSDALLIIQLANKKELVKYAEKLKKSQAETKKLKKSLIPIDKLTAGLLETENEIKKNEKGIRNLQSDKQLCETHISVLESNESKEMLTLLTRIQMASEAITSLDKEDKKVTHTLQVKEGEARNYRFWKSGFKTIEYNLMNNALKEFRDILILICKNSGLRFKDIKIDAFSKKADGDLKADLNIRIIRKTNGQLEDLSLENLSEGETQRIDIACFLTMSAFLTKYLGMGTGLLFLDEPFSALDTEGKEMMFNLLVSLIEKKQQIFVIDHDANFQDMVSIVITVDKNKKVTLHRRN